MVRAPAGPTRADSDSPDDPAARDVGDTARTFSIAAAVGSATALVVFAVLLWRRPPVFGGILDAQARALFHGHWNMPLRTLGIEAFDIHGRYYTYFGLWPSIVRMPVLLVTHRFDGRLTAPSMVLAFLVTMLFTARLHWAIRRAMRAEAPMSTGEALGVGGFQFLVGAGSIVIFLASRPAVYHELELWGIATGVLVADCLFRFVRDPTEGRALGAGAATTLAAMSRPSVGFGAIAAVAIVVAVEAWIRRRPDDAGGPGAWTPLGTLLATGVALPGVVYAAINEARFGSLFSLPLDRQVFTFEDHQRQVTLAHNGGSLFGLKFVPTTLVQYLRPDAVRVTSSYPFVDFPLHRAHVFGNVVFDTLDRSSSVTASMAGLTVLAVIGAIVLLRRRGLVLRALGPVVIGLAGGTVFVLTIAYVTNRYLADFLPPIVVLALVGVQGFAATRPSTSSRGRGALAALVVVCVFGAWVSFGLAVVYQRNLKPGQPGYGRGIAAAAGAAVAPRARHAPTAHTAPIAARITSDGSAVARRRVWP